MLIAQSQTIDIITFLRNAVSAAKKIGVYELSKRLEWVGKKDTYGGNEILIREFIVMAVCQECRISRKKLINSMEKGGVTYARYFCFALLKRHLLYPPKEIGRYMGRKHFSTVYYGLKQFDSLNAKLKHEKRYLEQFQRIEKQVSEFIKNLSDGEENTST